MIYLDNSATTRPCAEAVAAMTEMLTDCWGNPSSVHTLGIQAERRLKLARRQVAELLGAEASSPRAGLDQGRGRGHGDGPRAPAAGLQAACDPHGLLQGGQHGPLHLCA